jgi:hypothetical protein
LSRKRLCFRASLCSRYALIRSASRWICGPGARFKFQSDILLVFTLCRRLRDSELADVVARWSYLLLALSTRRLHLQPCDLKSCQPTSLRDRPFRLPVLLEVRGGRAVMEREWRYSFPVFPVANLSPDTSSAAAQEIHVRLLARKGTCTLAPSTQMRMGHSPMLRAELEANSTHAPPVVSQRTTWIGVDFLSKIVQQIHILI